MNVDRAGTRFAKGGVVGALAWWHRDAMPTFHGSIDALKNALLQAGCSGEWLEKPNSCWRFVGPDRAGLNWSVGKGTIWFDGPPDAKLQLAASVEAALGLASQQPARVSQDRVIFVVHGHDANARDQLELVLHKLGLQPFVLQNTDGGGLTIIESLERMIGKNAASAFGIVLLTPDDVGYSKRDGETEAKARARQNVILEMGMLLASLTRDRVAILQKGFVEHPSDVHGIIYLPFNDHVKEVVPKLASRLQAAGIAIGADKVSHAST
jgi:predicted nucleotide-binding protein